MKNIIVTVIVGFITGLVISGILFDVIKYIGKSFNRVHIAWNISKAEKFYSNERFSDSISLYNEVIPKIAPSNKLLLAKTKNNLALAMINKAKKDLADNVCSQEDFSIAIYSIFQITDVALNLPILTTNETIITYFLVKKQKINIRIDDK